MQERVINWRRYNHPSTSNSELALFDSLISDWFPGYWSKETLKDAKFTRQWALPAEKLVYLIRLPWVQLPIDEFLYLPEKGYEIVFIFSAESEQNAALISGPLPAAEQIKIFSSANGEYSQFWMTINGESIGWYWEDDKYIWSGVGRASTDGDRRRINFRPKSRAMPQELEMATWIIDDFDPGYYFREDIDEAKFSRQYIDRNRKALAFFILMPARHFDYSSLKVLSAMYEYAGEISVDGEICVSNQSFSDSSPHFADIDVMQSGKWVRYRWDGNSYKQHI